MECGSTAGGGNDITVTVTFRLSDDGDSTCETTDTIIPEVADATIVS